MSLISFGHTSFPEKIVGDLVNHLQESLADARWQKQTNGPDEKIKTKRRKRATNFFNRRIDVWQEWRWCFYQNDDGLSLSLSFSFALGQFERMKSCRDENAQVLLLVSMHMVKLWSSGKWRTISVNITRSDKTRGEKEREKKNNGLIRIAAFVFFSPSLTDKRLAERRKSFSVCRILAGFD